MVSEENDGEFRECMRKLEVYNDSVEGDTMRVQEEYHGSARVYMSVRRKYDRACQTLPR